jgi:hypothetical protein
VNPFLGPLDDQGRIPAQQQTRVSSFLISAHGALARQLAVAVPARLHDGWQVEMHAQYCREIEILSLLTRATSWVPDPTLAFLLWQWETAWLPRPAEGASHASEALLIDLAAFGHAVHAVTRPAALLPEAAAPMDPFALAMNRIELDGGRLMQAQIVFLKSAPLFPVRDAVAAALEWRHGQIRELWDAMLQGLDVDTSSRHLVQIAYQTMNR